MATGWLTKHYPSVYGALRRRGPYQYRWAEMSGTCAYRAHSQTGDFARSAAMLLTCSRLSFGNWAFRHHGSTTFLQKFFATLCWHWWRTLAGQYCRARIAQSTGLIWGQRNQMLTHTGAGTQPVRRLLSWSSAHLAFVQTLQDRLARDGAGQPGFQEPTQPGTPGRSPPPANNASMSSWPVTGCRKSPKYYGKP